MSYFEQQASLHVCYQSMSTTARMSWNPTGWIGRMPRVDASIHSLQGTSAPHSESSSNYDSTSPPSEDISSVARGTPARLPLSNAARFPPGAQQTKRRIAGAGVWNDIAGLRAVLVGNAERRNDGFTKMWQGREDDAYWRHELVNGFKHADFFLTKQVDFVSVCIISCSEVSLIQRSGDELQADRIGDGNSSSGETIS
ncbi:unnamed protein product [Toxocara canis]|uniref:Uncharacterized protein n=1 Tax=Toxocara canis TaxID=6265 RepID=A0A183UJW1_TOXCA|nr:unnamed protein product [Toxocara canis]